MFSSPSKEGHHIGELAALIPVSLSCNFTTPPMKALAVDHLFTRTLNPHPFNDHPLKRIAGSTITTHIHKCKARCRGVNRNGKCNCIRERSGTRILRSSFFFLLRRRVVSCRPVPCRVVSCRVVPSRVVASCSCFVWVNPKCGGVEFVLFLGN